jgi:hypothetical protein
MISPFIDGRAWPFWSSPACAVNGTPPWSRWQLSHGTNVVSHERVEDERPTKALGFGDIIGRRNKLGEPSVGHREGIHSERTQPRCPPWPFAIDRDQRILCSHDGLAAGKANRA